MRPRLLIYSVICLLPLAAMAEPVLSALEFRRDIRPILEKYCFDCHADGADKGGVAFDSFATDRAVMEDHDLWLRALKNVRAGMMPPLKKAQPTPAERARLEQWIKGGVFGIDPQSPDPGRITLRRLNRVEYRNTIRDLMDVDYDTQSAFPADDTGYGFDNIGDVLTLPSMLLEKYLLAANTIVAETVPMVGKVPAEQKIAGRSFQPAADGQPDGGPLPLSYYEAASVAHDFEAGRDGHYQLALHLTVNEKFVDDVFDYNKCRLIFKVDGEELLRQDFSWEGGKPYNFQFERDWTAGKHQLAFELQPLTPGEKQNRTLSLQINSVNVRGPMAKEHWVAPKNHARFFPKEVPESAAGRRRYARELLEDFTRRAFRRPADKETLDRLVTLAEFTSTQSGKPFEAGVAQAMVAVLASPQFLFRGEGIETLRPGQPHPFVDEYALASRLSYFLWSSMPDEELFRLAATNGLRKNLPAQFARMLADRRADALVKNFTGQWLQARDIETVPIEARAVLAREEKFDPDAERLRKRREQLRNKPEDQLTQAEKEELAAMRAAFRGRRQPRADLNVELRRAMRQETEKFFGHILQEDRSLLELLDSDYTFLNERLARHYGITNVVGTEMRRVTLPPGSPRGGIITQGTALIVTSNPTRTSPVKRGLFILDNLLGTPPAPPPPDIPSLEEAAREITDHPPTLRESLAVHRENALCSSCHNRMDPLGLALENFNAMGMWRDQEREQPIDVRGMLITGESFETVKELKGILVKNHATQFYRTLTEKLLTYALGRGLEYYDVATVDQIVGRIEQANGRPGALLLGIVESAPFQQSRNLIERDNSKPLQPRGQRADARITP